MRKAHAKDSSVLGVDMPRTLERSPEKAQRTYAKTLRSAEKEYGSGERAGPAAAYASLKHRHYPSLLSEKASRKPLTVTRPV